jgi:hypothetical protein
MERKTLGSESCSESKSLKTIPTAQTPLAGEIFIKKGRTWCTVHSQPMHRNQRVFTPIHKEVFGFGALGLRSVSARLSFTRRFNILGPAKRSQSHLHGKKGLMNSSQSFQICPAVSASARNETLDHRNANPSQISGRFACFESGVGTVPKKLVLLSLNNLNGVASYPVLLNLQYSRKRDVLKV